MEFFIQGLSVEAKVIDIMVVRFDAILVHYHHICYCIL